MSLDDYELLNILDKDKNPKIFKVRHKNTGEQFVWYTIDYKNQTNQQSIHLEEKFAARKGLQHPNLLEFHDLIKEEDSRLYYLVVKYCKHGSLKDLMDMVFNDNKRFTEEFLCKILYQIAFTVKTVNIATMFDIKDIYFDEKYNVKFFNFNINTDETKLKSPKISTLGSMIFEVCTLTKFSKKYFEKELKHQNNLYSKDFLTLLITIIKDNRDLKRNIDKVMCSSTLLLKITQWSKYKCFLKIDELNYTSQTVEKPEDLYVLHMEILKEKEVILQKKENLLKERENKISIKEKRLALIEKQLKESLKQAEEIKNNIKRSCNCSLKESQKESIKENLDSTYISCGDSIIVPTSKKLNVNDIVKPAIFTRTLSEKRIRFKGHSPLKDINFNRRRTVRYTKSQNVPEKNGDWITCSDDTEKSTLQRKVPTKKKQLFHTYENNIDIERNEQLPKPLKWTEENKKYAFDLLRLINKDKENKPPDIKHTYL